MRLLQNQRARKRRALPSPFHALLDFPSPSARASLPAIFRERAGPALAQGRSTLSFTRDGSVDPPRRSPPSEFPDVVPVVPLAAAAPVFVPPVPPMLTSRSPRFVCPPRGLRPPPPVPPLDDA